MSASREKKKRMELAEAGVLPKQLAAKAKAKKRRKTIITSSIIAALVLIAAGIGFYRLYYLPQSAPKKTVAATIGEHTLTAADMNYYYMDTVYQFYQNSSSYLSYMLDTTKGLDEQNYSDDQTWAEYLMEQAAQTAAGYYALYDKAQEEGFTLTEEQEKEVEDQYQLVEDSILSSDQYSSMNQYLSSYYGKGSTAKSYREYLTLRGFVDQYTTSYSENLSYTPEELEAVVNENPNKYTNVTYRAYYIPLSNYQSDDADETATADTAADTAAESEETEAVDAEALQAAEADAREMAEASQNNEQAYLQYTRDLNPEDSQANYSDDATTLKENAEYDSIPELARDWLYDASRQEGDTTYINSDDTGYYVFYFISANTNDYNTVNVRHILISTSNDTDTDGDGTDDAPSEDTLAEAQKKAEELLEEWKNGDATEESFAALAEENTDDSAKDGLYENVKQGQMVTEFNDWCFDPARKPGDTDIVKTTYGYHVMYFCSTGLNCRQVMAEEDTREADYQEWYDGITKDAPYELHDEGVKYVNTNLVLSQQ